MAPVMPGVSGAAAAALLVLAAMTSACAQDVAALAARCDACHGEQGIPTDPAMPVIWGQHQPYLLRQLGEFKHGNRRNEQMLALMRDMSDGQQSALADYFAQKPWPRLAQPPASAAETKRAQAAIVAGQCVACHGILLTGNERAYQPRG
jgi:cytochrome c553